MASARRQTQRFQLFTQAYPQEAETKSRIAQLLSKWIDSLQQSRKHIDSVIHDNMKVLGQQTGYVELFEQLSQLLSSELKVDDLQKVIADAQLLLLLLKKSQLEELQKNGVVKSLLAFTEEFVQSRLDNDITENFRLLSSNLGALLPHEQLGLFWSLMLSPQSSHPPAPLPQHAIRQVTYLQAYLIKRQLAISVTDPECKILGLNLQEGYWLNSLQVNMSGEKKSTEQDRLLATSASLLMWAFNKIDSSSSATQTQWSDPLLQKKQGIQTQLFSRKDIDQNTASLLDSKFTSLLLDLRNASPGYAYQKKILRQWEPQVQQELNLVLQHENFTPGFNELMLFKAEEIMPQKGLLLLLFKREFLTSEADSPLRKYLALSYRQIFVVDFYLDKDTHEEGVCAIFLLSGKPAKQSTHAKIQYCSFSCKNSDPGNIDEFESINWLEILPEKQSYWIGLPPSDFLDLIPALGSESAFFRADVKPSESLMPDWLTADDPQLLQKKAKYLIREYQKSLSPKGRPLNPEIRWPTALKKMAEQGVPLEFNAELIRPIMVSPLVPTYIYAEEKLLKNVANDHPTIMLQTGRTEVTGCHLAYRNILPSSLALPLQTDSAKGVETNISDSALQKFKSYYHQKSKSLDSNFIVFPPENITATLDKIVSISRDLPVLKKYPEQINRMLEDARNFTSDVQLLSPPYEKIEEFRQKVLRLERDAIERRVIYQRVKDYIEELKEQLNDLTYEYDQARQDLQSVSKDNIFYYYYAVLHDPGYTMQYQDYLQWELPRVPLYPHFRQWVSWGRELFTLHSRQQQIPETPLRYSEESGDNSSSNKFTYQLKPEEGTLLLQEGTHHLLIEGIDENHLSFKVGQKTPLEYFLEHLKYRKKQNRLVSEKFKQEVLENPKEVFSSIAEICALSQRSHEICQLIQKADKS